MSPLHMAACCTVVCMWHEAECRHAGVAGIVFIVVWRKETTSLSKIEAAQAEEVCVPSSARDPETGPTEI